MSDMESVTALMDSTSSKIQQLKEAFAELESRSAVSMNLKWKQLEDHFRGLEQSLKKRLDALKEQEEEFQETVAKSEQMLEQQEAAVVAKELISLERLQEKRDAALAMIFSKSRLSLPVPVINPMNKALDNLGVKWPKPASEESVYLQIDNAAVRPRSELVALCEEMNVKGLHKFISDNRKNLAAIREEIPSALKKTSHPYSLVLDSLEDFYSGDNLVLDGKKDGDLLGVRRTCLMLMESLGQLQTNDITCFSSEGHMLTTNIIERAKKIAFEWKSNLDNLDIDASNGNCLEAHAFLQLLATFGISSEYNEDDLCKLLPYVSRRRQTPELCRLLGLSQKMPGQCCGGLMIYVSQTTLNICERSLFFQLIEMLDKYS